MPFKIHDGFTIAGKTSGKGNGENDPQPVLSFTYRPALAEEMTEFRFDQQRATDGKQIFAVRVAFVKSRLVSWDFVTDDDKPRPITEENLRALPEAVFIDLVHECSLWKPKPQEDVRKNS